MSPGRIHRQSDGEPRHARRPDYAHRWDGVPLREWGELTSPRRLSALDQQRYAVSRHDQPDTRRLWRSRWRYESLEASLPVDVVIRGLLLGQE